MKDLSKEMKVVKIIFCFISVVVMIIGLGFSYLIAEFDDAPRFYFHRNDSNISMCFVGVWTWRNCNKL